MIEIWWLSCKIQKIYHSTNINRSSRKACDFCYPLLYLCNFLAILLSIFQVFIRNSVPIVSRKKSMRQTYYKLPRSIIFYLLYSLYRLCFFNLSIICTYMSMLEIVFLPPYLSLPIYLIYICNLSKWKVCNQLYSFLSTSP